MKFLILLALAPLTVLASVQNICSLDRPRVDTVTNLSELEDNICEVRDSSNDREITSMSQQSLQILQNLQSQAPSQEDPLNNPQLVESLRNVANLVTGKRSPTSFSSERRNALGTSLNQLFGNFGSEAQRKGNQQGYYQAMRAVLSKTREGARVLQCFERLDPGVLKTVVNLAESGEAAPSATYEAQYDAASQKYLKIITIGAGDSPALTLALLAHEMQHACNTPEFIRIEREQRDLQTRYQTLVESPYTTQAEADAFEQDFKTKAANANVRYALDELRAYRMTPKIFSELAPYHPEFFCNQYYVSALFGRQILGTGDYMSSVETMVADGSFVYNLIDNYIKGSGYDPTVFYVMDQNTGDIQRDAQGRPLFRQEVRAAITREGFRVP